MYEYKANVVRVVDGDTIIVDLDLGFGLWKRNETLRLIGINTPESRGSEKEKGKIAKAFVEQFLPIGKEIFVVTSKSGKYGRYLAEIHFETDQVSFYMDNFNEYLIETGYAKAYDGKEKMERFPLEEEYPIIRRS